jgi:hypothetical protein
VACIFHYVPREGNDAPLLKNYKNADRDCFEYKDKNACIKRAKLAKELKLKGYCWGPAELKWFKCN